MGSCTRCGLELAEGASYCAGCGMEAPGLPGGPGDRLAATSCVPIWGGVLLCPGLGSFVVAVFSTVAYLLWRRRWPKKAKAVLLHGWTAGLAGGLLWVGAFVWIEQGGPMGISRSKQKRAMSEIRSVATAVQSFATDYDVFPDSRGRVIPLKDLDAAAKATSALVSDKPSTITPDYVRVPPVLDNWGNPYYYAGDRKNFVILDFGSDGKPDADTQRVLDGWIVGGGEPKNLAASPTTHCYEADIIWGTDQFLKVPEGPQRHCDDSGVAEAPLRVKPPAVPLPQPVKTASPSAPPETAAPGDPEKEVIGDGPLLPQSPVKPQTGKNAPWKEGTPAP